MPGTWALMRTRLNLGTNPHDPRDNIIAGTAYLRMMYDQFGYPGLFGAYNAEPGRYSAYLAGKSRLPSETTAYMASVGTVRSHTITAVFSTKLPADGGLFYRVQSRQEVVPTVKPHPASSGLFITLSTVSGAER
jgi:hypothetical protein